MSEEQEKYLVDRNWGGARVAGPGKTIGRPSGKTRTPMTFKIPNVLADRLKGEENQTGLIVRLLSEYYGISEP